MTRKQRQRLKDRRKKAVDQAKTRAEVAAAKRAARRANPRPARFWAPQNRSWIMVHTMQGRGLHAASDLRKQGVPVFEAKAATRFVTSRGQQRTAEIAVLKRTLFVGIATLADLVLVERCIWVSNVLAPNGSDGAAWVDRLSFRPGWVECETFGGRRMPVITRDEMQRFADHVSGYLKADEEVAEPTIGPAFNVGVKVLVTDGPFASFAGTVEAYDLERDLYDVSVNIFGRQTSTELSEDWLKAA